MSSIPLPKAARGAVFVALLIALVSGVSVRSGPIMLLAVCLIAVAAAVGILLRRVWSAFGFALLLGTSIVAMLIFAVTGQSAGSFLQVLVSVVLYSLIAGLFVLAGLSLKVTGARSGSPVPWIAVAILLSTPFMFLQPVSISNKAMEKSLLIGDFVLVNRFSGSPALRDIVAFRDPKDHSRVLVARVTGLPNQAAPAHHYRVQGDAATQAPIIINAGDLIGKPKFIYDSLAPDEADINKQGELINPTHPPLHRWDRIFKTL